MSQIEIYHNIFDSTAAKRKFGFLHCEMDDALLGITLADLFKIASLFNDNDNIIMYLEKEDVRLYSLYSNRFIALL